jgi:hypothetical protein
LRFKRGVEIDLRDGKARLTVAHRVGAHWTVFAGPFRVDVTGTRFAVNWSESSGRFRIAMLEGEVHISGGPLSAAMPLHAGQTLDGTKSTVEVTDTPEVKSERLRDDAESPTRQVPVAKTDPISPLPQHPRRAPPTGPTRRRAEVNAGTGAGDKRDSYQGLNQAPSRRADGIEMPVPNQLPPEFWVAIPPPAAPALAAKPTPGRVAIGADGRFSGGFTGFAWVERGEGTSLSAPTSWESRAHLQPEDGLLCTSGTVVALSCVNEGMPSISCNWVRNWGVAIGWDTSADKKAWGVDAASAIAIEFRGRSGKYRLNAHRHGEPAEKTYCIENYKSDQVAKPSMFKSECWSNTGVPLPDFEDVDLFNLQFLSGMNYVAFRYCIAGITLYP